MRRAQVLAVVLGFAVGVVLGCGTKAPDASGGGSGEPAPKGGTPPGGGPVIPPGPIKKEDVPNAKKKLEELEKTIAAKEKELADLRAEAASLRKRIDEAGGSSATALLDLLAKLPKEKWPKDDKDTLRMEQANEWFKKNLVGQRTSWTGVKASAIKFRSESDGKYTASIYQQDIPPAKLYGGEWRISLGNGGLVFDHVVQVDAEGLSERAAEQLRAWPKDKPLGITFKITGVELRSAGCSFVEVADVKFVGIDP